MKCGSGRSSIFTIVNGTRQGSILCPALFALYVDELLDWLQGGWHLHGYRWFLNGEQLPWVESALHLGHVLHESGSMEKDIKAKRASFIGEGTECRQTFGFDSPSEAKGSHCVCWQSLWYQPGPSNG